MYSVDAPLHAAVSELCQHHHGWLRGWLRRRPGCHEPAADLAQDTFTRVLGSRRALGFFDVLSWISPGVPRLLIVFVGMRMPRRPQEPR